MVSLMHCAGVRLGASCDSLKLTQLSTCSYLQVHHGDSGHLLSSMGSVECAAHIEASSSDMDDPPLAHTGRTAEAQEAAEALQAPADFRPSSGADGRHSL